MICKIKELAENKDVVVLCNTKNKNQYEDIQTLCMGNELEEISSNIFTLLRKADKLKKELIIIEGVQQEGLGLAIMNRLIRACEHNYIKI